MRPVGNWVIMLRQTTGRKRNGWRDDTYGALTLVEAGVDVNAQGDMSETPLHIAVRKRNDQIVAALLNAGADPQVKSEFGMSAAQMVATERAANRVFVQVIAGQGPVCGRSQNSFQLA